MNTGSLTRALNFIQDWLADRYQREEVPGFVVAVAHQGKVRMNVAFGYADLERRIPMTPDHIFHIASHSKTFTATAIMQLQEQGRLAIDHPASRYLPWLSSHQDPRWQLVTIRQLLSHGAGVIRDGLESDFWSLTIPFPDAERFSKEILETDLVLENNQEMKYSNYGYTLLGMVIEAASGQPYNEFVLENIVRPLGLTRTFPEYRPDLQQPNPDHMVTGYSRRDLRTRRPLPHPNTQAMSAATGFVSTTADLCQYFTAQMVASGDLLSDESKKAMQKPEWPQKNAEGTVVGAYGLGFFRKSFGTRETFGHGGGFPGCITNTMADPKDNLVVTALTNAIDGPADALVAAVYQIINFFQDHSSDSPHRLYEGHYMNLWDSVRYVAAGDSLYAVHGVGWNPLAFVETLTEVGDAVFRIDKTGSGSSKGERVQFTNDEGCVKTVNSAGATLWPREVWLQKHQSAL